MAAALARKNRGAQVGIFVFARHCAPPGLEIFGRYGTDLVVVWDSEDPTTDVYIKAAYSVARALVVAKTNATRERSADFMVIDQALLEIGKNAESLEEILDATKTLTNATDKIAERARLARERILKDLQRLKEHTDALRR